jgi:glycosyltransferase involved in cell wall biosynthesis
MSSGNIAQSDLGDLKNTGFTEQIGAAVFGAFLLFELVEGRANSMSNPIISIVICTYNRGNLLPGCLAALVNQTAAPSLYEIVVINNNSTDNTEKITGDLVKDHSNIRLVTESEQGLSPSRNRGYQEAKGEYVAYIDDDAKAAPNWVETAVKIVNEAQPDIFGGPIYPFYRSSKPAWFKDEYEIRVHAQQTGWMESGWLSGSNIVFKKTFLTNSTGFNPQFGMKGDSFGYHEETQLVLEAFQNKKRIYYSLDLIVNHLVPEYKYSLAYFIYSRYKSGKDSYYLRTGNFSQENSIELLAFLDETMTEFEVALKKRDLAKYPFPENYIIERFVRNFGNLGLQIEYFHKNKVFDLNNQLPPEIEEWQKQPLSGIYPLIFIDAVDFCVRDNNVIRKLAVHIIFGINAEGRKEVLSIRVGENENSKYWLSILNELKNRGVKDIMVLCADGLTGIKQAISVAYPQTEYQWCLVHQVRNTLKYVAGKDKRALTTDLKTIYHASSEGAGYQQLKEVTEKWQEYYPNAMKSWVTNWDVISPIFKFSSEVRKVIYITNAIENLNSTYRRLNRQRSVFPSDSALLTALYLTTFAAVKKWTRRLRNWDKVYGELSVMYEGRFAR